MKSVYLIEKTQLKELKKKVKDISSVTMRSQEYGEKERGLLIVTFSTCKMGIDDARALSKVRSSIPDPKLAVFDEGNLYYVRRLYARLSEFEQKLRGVIRLRVILDDTSEVKIDNELELMTFGKYCSAFFGDAEFANQAKAITTKKEYFDEKSYLLQLLEGIDSECFWDKHFDSSEMPAFRERHHDIRSFRNDVMHIHFITYEEYLRAEKLLKKACEELDAFIGGMLVDAPDDSVSFAADFSDAIRAIMLATSEFIEFDNPYPATLAHAMEAINGFNSTMSNLNNEALKTALSAIQLSINEQLVASLYSESLAQQLSEYANSASAYGVSDARKGSLSNIKGPGKESDDNSSADSDEEESE